VGYAIAVLVFISASGWVLVYDKPFVLGAQLQNMTHSMKFKRGKFVVIVG
jgi:hypothetical protein